MKKHEADWLKGLERFPGAPVSNGDEGAVEGQPGKARRARKAKAGKAGRKRAAKAV